MVSSALQSALTTAFIELYAVYLKTQAYHWYVVGNNFIALHQLFDKQYHDLADAADELAERLVALDIKVNINFSHFAKNSAVNENNIKFSATEMLRDLIQSHQHLVQRFRNVCQMAQAEQDYGTDAMISDMITDHEKIIWMLQAQAAA